MAVKIDKKRRCGALEKDKGKVDKLGGENNDGFEEEKGNGFWTWEL